MIALWLDIRDYCIGWRSKKSRDTTEHHSGCNQMLAPVPVATSHS